MPGLTFKGGIHPNERKGLTEEYKVSRVLLRPKTEMIFPMSQHIGAPCEPTVAIGDRVLTGQKIGEPKAYVSAPVHSSVSGTVTDIRPVLNATGSVVNAVIVENDGLYEEIEGMEPKKHYSEYTKEEKLEIIKEAGVVGLGGAGFPTHVKLNVPADKDIDTVIINAAECEPYLTTDYRVMIEEGENLISGLQIILSIVSSAKRGVIAIEDNKPKAIKHLKELAKDVPNIEVVAIKTKYPQGSEKQLIYSITKREVPSGGLPSDVGCVVNNVDTAVAISRAFMQGRPLMRKIVTVSGKAVVNPGNYEVRLGMTFRDLIEFTGGLKEEPKKIVAGGPMMGVALYSLDVPIIKTSGGILCLTEEETYVPENFNCIRCSKCVQICPMGLMPLYLDKFVLEREFDNFKKYNGLDCVECGSCSYVCPAKRSLAQSIRSTKKELLKKK